MTLSDKEKNRLQTKYGPWALVTGASSGIGREISTRLAEAGLNLIIHGRNEKKLSQLEKELRSGYGVEVKTEAADLSESTGIGQIIESARNLDIGLLVISAGFGTSGSFLNASFF